MRTLSRFALIAAVLPSCAFAHVGHPATEDFASGLLHIFSGLDHLAALWCLGALAALFSRATGPTPAKTNYAPGWVWLPGLFSLGTVAGIFIARQGLAINPEPIIGFSILFWGILLVARRQLHLAAHAIAAVVFAFFHGLAHGPALSALMAPTAFYSGLGVGFALCFCAGFFATYYLTPGHARQLTGFVSLAGLSYFVAAGGLN